MNVIDEMANEALTDNYFIELFQIVEKQYWRNIIFDQIFVEASLSKKQYDDILTFADILSLSSNPEHNNLALKIISYLKVRYEDDEKFKYFSRGIMIRLGNFPGYNLLTSADSTESPMPLDLSLEKQFKERINKDLYSDKVFTDSQYFILQELLEKNHFSFSAPTSFGKSFVLTSFIKILMMNNSRGLNIVFLVPTRALVSQTLRKLRKIVSNSDGYYLSSSPDIPTIMNRTDSHYIFVFTPERLLHYFSTPSNPSIEYVFVDEAQKILSEDIRSVVYYHAISLAERKSCKLFFSAPNIGNSEIFLKLFNKTLSESKTILESPVCQTRIFIDMLDKKVIFFSDLDSVYEEKCIFPSSLSELIFKISQKVNSANPKCLIYCNTIEDTIKCAKQMSDYITGVSSKALDKAADEIACFIHKEYYLVDFIRNGVGFHFGKLPQKIRDIVEELYQNGDIHFLFCTSTLLEGVNLPAQSIFILNNQIGNKNMESIDFWNLAGRAGRLAKELCGNVICVKWVDKKGRWDSSKSIEIIKNKRTSPINSNIITGKSKFYTNILCAAQDKPFTKANVSETQRRVYNAFSNVLISHFNEDQTSLLRNEFQKKEPKGVKILNEIKKEITIPAQIISRFPLIKARYQNDIWNLKETALPVLAEPTYDNCLNMLKCLFDLYHWDIEESQGVNPLFPKGNRNLMKHYASLMSDWMGSTSLNEIIRRTLLYYKGKAIKDGYLPNGRINLVEFNPNNKTHINIIINKTISEIDEFIRFTLKNYFENYYCILSERFGNKKYCQDWSLYLEHGTTRKELIEIQKIGVPRHISKIFYDDFKQFIMFNDKRELIFMQTSQIAQKLKDVDKPEYKEILLALSDNCIL